jgi:hypothetical protein
MSNAGPRHTQHTVLGIRRQHTCFVRKMGFTSLRTPTETQTRSLVAIQGLVNVNKGWRGTSVWGLQWFVERHASDLTKFEVGTAEQCLFAVRDKTVKSLTYFMGYVSEFQRRHSSNFSNISGTRLCGVLTRHLATQVIFRLCILEEGQWKC